jgi:hypothetical protein
LFRRKDRRAGTLAAGLLKELKTETVDGIAPVKRASNRALDKRMGSRVRKVRDFLHPHQKGQMTTKQLHDWLAKQQPTHPCSMRTSSSYRNGYTNAEKIQLEMKLSVRELAQRLRQLKRANSEGDRFSKRVKGNRFSTRGQPLPGKQEGGIEDARGNYFDCAGGTHEDGLSDSGSDTSDGEDGKDCSSVGKKRPADRLPSMALNEAEQRRMISYLARQMNFPPEFDPHTGLPNWRGGKGGTIAAITRLLDLRCDPDTVYYVLRRTYNAFMDCDLENFDAGEREVKTGRKVLMEDFEIMLAIRNLRDGCGFDLTLMVANELRFACDPPKPEICNSTLRNYCKSWGLNTHKRQSRGTGDKATGVPIPQFGSSHPPTHLFAVNHVVCSLLMMRHAGAGCK